MRQYRIYICSSSMKTCQISMVDSAYSDEPRMHNNGVSWVRLGVYFGILWFRIRYESMSLTCVGLALYKKVEHFEHNTNKSSIALM